MAKNNLADMFGKGPKKKGAPDVPARNPGAKKNPMARPSLAALDAKC